MLQGSAPDASFTLLCCLLSASWLQGKFMEVGGVNTYVAAGNEGASPPTNAVIVVTDVFGVQFVNNQLLAGLDHPCSSLMSCP